MKGLNKKISKQKRHLRRRKSIGFSIDIAYKNINCRTSVLESLKWAMRIRYRNQFNEPLIRLLPIFNPNEGKHKRFFFVRNQQTYLIRLAATVKKICPKHKCEKVAMFGRKVIQANIRKQRRMGQILGSDNRHVSIFISRLGGLFFMLYIKSMINGIRFYIYLCLTTVSRTDKQLNITTGEIIMTVHIFTVDSLSKN